MRYAVHKVKAETKKNKTSRRLKRGLWGYPTINQKRRSFQYESNFIITLKPVRRPARSYPRRSREPRIEVIRALPVPIVVPVIEKQAAHGCVNHPKVPHCVPVPARDVMRRGHPDGCGKQGVPSMLDPQPHKAAHSGRYGLVVLNAVLVAVQVRVPPGDVFNYSGKNDNKHSTNPTRTRETP